MDKRLIILYFFLISFVAGAQVPVEKPGFGVSLISPKYFGPYAFPVPELLEGRICNDLHIELAGDAVSGNAAVKEYEDMTYAATFKASVPLWTDRATLSIWGEMHEWYSDTPQVRDIRRVGSQYPLKGDDAGNLYFSIDMLVLKETTKRPSIALRAATQSATGDKYEVARHYDAPGYFFDISTGKNFGNGTTGIFRISASAGFLCWQIDRGCQNDALMMGAKMSYSLPFLSISAEYGQYTGLETRKSADAGDSPKTVRAGIQGHFGKVSPFVNWQKGLNDWPFSMVRAGISVDLDIL